MATSTQTRKISKTQQRTWRKVINLYQLPDIMAAILLAVGAIFMALPFLWMFSTSLRPSAESYKLPPAWLPTEWHFENYQAVFQSSVPILTFAFNSAKVTNTGSSRSVTVTPVSVVSPVFFTSMV